MKSAPCQKPVLPANPSSPLSFRHDPQPHCIYDTITHTAYNDAAEPSARGNRPCQSISTRIGRSFNPSSSRRCQPFSFPVVTTQDQFTTRHHVYRLKAQGSGSRLNKENGNRREKTKSPRNSWKNDAYARNCIILFVFTTLALAHAHTLHMHTSVHTRTSQFDNLACPHAPSPQASTAQAFR